jgi:alanine racemase
LQQAIAKVDLSAIAFNLKGVQKKVAPASVMAVVKANAYGHGAITVSRLALEQGCRYLAVARVDEAIELRKAGIEAPILVFGGFSHDDVFFIPRFDIEATVYEEHGLKQLATAASQAQQQVRVHVKIDTGMGRIGVNWQQALPFIQRLLEYKELTFHGLYSHFATADCLDKSFSRLQLERFKQVVGQLESAGIHVAIKHFANSGAILDMADSYFDMVRPGIMMYGYYPSHETSESVPLRPAMTFITQVMQVKTVERGESVSYDRLYIAKAKTRIATLAVGYADGYNRLLTHGGQVLIHGRCFPVVGRVCMDLIMVDLGDDSNVKIGDEAVLFGKQNDQWITVDSICEKLHTIPYEVTCWVAKRVPRVYLNSAQQ